MNSDYLLLMRATPGDNPRHTVDARDVALGVANAVDRGDEDDMMAVVGIGRLGPSALLDFQQHDWSHTMTWVAQSQGGRVIALRLLGPALPAADAPDPCGAAPGGDAGALRRPVDPHRGQYGTHVLAATDG